MKRLSFRAVLLICLLAVAASSQSSYNPREGERPDAEFQIARVIYRTNARAGSHGTIQPMWAVDYPLAEAHFLPALRRYTRLDVAEDSRHLELTDERLFQYPFLLLQQPGYWFPDDEEVAALREYLLRGGFLLFDDFHGDDWFAMEEGITRVLPEFSIVDIPQNDSVMQIFFPIDQRTQIPGERHLRRGIGGDVVVNMPPPRWKGIYDDRGRLIVAMNHNMDMGDAWEHADDPGYPLPMTAFSYQLGVNYILYAITH
jgi:hypothetical protein